MSQKTENAQKSQNTELEVSCPATPQQREKLAAELAVFRAAFPVCVENLLNSYKDLSQSDFLEALQELINVTAFNSSITSMLRLGAYVPVAKLGKVIPFTVIATEPATELELEDTISDSSKQATHPAPKGVH